MMKKYYEDDCIECNGLGGWWWGCDPVIWNVCHVCNGSCKLKTVK